MEEEGEVDLAEPDYYATLNVPRDVSRVYVNCTSIRTAQPFKCQIIVYLVFQIPAHNLSLF